MGMSGSGETGQDRMSGFIIVDNLAAGNSGHSVCQYPVAVYEFDQDHIGINISGIRQDTDHRLEAGSVFTR